MKALRIGLLMAVQYGLIVMNVRYVAAHSYLGTVATDAVIATNGFMLTRFVVNADTWWEKIAYVVGACLGSVIALRLT